MSVQVFVLATLLWIPLIQALLAEAVVRMPPAYHNGNVSVETTSIAGNLDGPKFLTAVNESSFDFWYFSAVSTSTDASVIITFFNSGAMGNSNPLTVQVSGSFSNGERFTGQVFATSDTLIKQTSEGVSGTWGGTGAFFTGTSLERSHITYKIHLDMPTIGVQGMVILNSRAPSHYPCDLNIPGVSQNLLPHLFWSNALPDSDAFVDLSVNGTSLNFNEGIGYHDKNWGDEPVYTSAKSWDWGHARFGPYSVVWFDILDRFGTEHVSAFVAHNGRPILVSCNISSLQVRQWGGDSAYPPALGLGNVVGVTSRFDLGNGVFLTANMTTTLLIEDLGGGIFTRAIGSVRGGLEGKEIFEGRGSYDENIFG